jgi:hypothetical protein
MQPGGRRDLDLQLGPDKRSSTRAMQLHYRSGSQERDFAMADRRGAIPGTGGTGTRSEQIRTRGGRAQTKIVP